MLVDEHIGMTCVLQLQMRNKFQTRVVWTISRWVQLRCYNCDRNGKLIICHRFYINNCYAEDKQSGWCPPMLFDSQRIEEHPRNRIREMSQLIFRPDPNRTWQPRTFQNLGFWQSIRRTAELTTATLVDVTNETLWTQLEVWQLSGRR